MRRPRLRLLPLLAVVVACSTPTAPDATGVWGGPEASLALSRAGGALSYVCGAGTMDATWVLSRDGRLTGTGQHYLGGGPVPIGGRPPHPAVYSGVIEGNTLILTVTLTDLGQTLGPFTLVRGGPLVQEMCV
jgi:hypothetical protein